MPEIIAGMYELEEKIGAGGAGIVYLGKHLRLGKKVVLKADKRTLRTKPEILRREVDALKNLSHTYIPQVYDFIAEGDTVYTVMDYIEGESLDRPLKRGERFSQPQVIEWACELLEALCYLHSRPPYGILHSDIKPANIMVTPQGEIRLIDFNIALALGESGSVRVGFSRGYASPEHYGLDYTVHPAGNTTSRNSVATGSSTGSGRGILLDVRSDIYSVGATLYHLLTGVRPPQDAEEVPAITDKSVSPAVAAIVRKAMRPNPDERYQTAAEMLAAFENLHRNDPRARRRRRAIACTVAALVTLFLSGGALAFAGQRGVAELDSERVLIEQAANALRAGDVASAVRLSASTQTLQRGIFDPPNLAEGQRVLTDALGVYNLESGFDDYRTLNLPSEPLKVQLSPEGTRLAVIYAWELAVYDLDTMNRLAVLDVEESALSDVVFLDENRVAYAGAGGVRVHDVSEGRELWAGERGTKVVRSADGRRIASVYKDEPAARIYDADSGELLKTVSFGGKRQWVAANDGYLDPGDNLLSLNADGSLLAVSFDDGSLTVFDLESAEGEAWEVLDPSDFIHFEGGFCGRYLAFSACTGTNNGASLFAAVDMVELAQTVLFDLSGPVRVQCDEDGVYFTVKNRLVKVDPATGDYTEVAGTENEIAAFRHVGEYAIVSEKMPGQSGRFSLFDRRAAEMARVDTDASCDFADLRGKFALTGSHNAPVLRLMKLDDHADARIFSYDPADRHDEARLSADGKTVTLFRYDAFRVFDIGGQLISAQTIPDAREVYDQQFRRDGGKSWLEVTYNSGFVRDYSAADGAILGERQGDAPDLTFTEEFLTDRFRIVRTFHEAPVVYDRQSGEQIRELEQDDTLAYVDQVGENLLTWYITAQGEWYGLLLDEHLDTLARLPNLCDVLGNRVVFDYPSGELKESPLYSLEDLLSMAEAYS
ncbi:MAG: protein kinase [Oscillibacter sp.]|nr:protein kinase [Oscillibacter sp.]